MYHIRYNHIMTIYIVVLICIAYYYNRGQWISLRPSAVLAAGGDMCYMGLLD